MKILKGVFLSLLLASLLMTTISATNGMPDLLAGDLLWNIESIYYYVDTSASTYTTNISNAAYNWVYTGFGWNNLYPNTRIYSINDSAYDIYSYSGYDGANAYTTFWARTYVTYGNAYQVSPYSDDWLYCEVNLNNYYLDNLTSNEIQAVLAHEMGHVWGLDDNNGNQYSIMCQAGAGRAVYTVQEVDHDAFNLKHP